MKILTIGPEGVGKTVFLTMLTSHMSSKSCPRPIHVESFKAAEKIEGYSRILKSGEWPPRNTEGTPHEIFSFRVDTPKGIKIHLWDFPGEHFRKSTLDPSTPDPNHSLKNLRDTIEEAHMLIYLLDLGDFQDAETSPKLTEDAWLFKGFLDGPNWRDRQRIVVVTKADRFRGLLKDAHDDPKQLIINAWPEGIIACPLTAQSHPGIDFFAVTSVKPKTHIDENRQAILRPKTPLESEGFEALIERIIKGLSGRRVTKFKNALLIIRRGIKQAASTTSGLFRKLSGKAKAFLILAGATFTLCTYYLATTDNYEFKIVTGDRLGAGTDSSVHIRMVGSNGKSSDATLGTWRDRLASDPFERKSTSIFERRLPKMGRVKSLTVTISKKGHKPAWFLSNIQVTNTNTGTKQLFKASRWMGQDQSNPGIDPWVITLSPTRS